MKEKDGKLGKAVFGPGGTKEKDQGGNLLLTNSVNSEQGTKEVRKYLQTAQQIGRAPILL